MASEVSSREDDYDDLWETEWVEIPDIPYIVKYKFEEDRYIILITNLKEIYGEKLTAAEVKERFSILNPHAEMKPCVIIKHTKESLEFFLRKDISDSRCVQQCTLHPQVITMHLSFIVSQVIVKFEIKPQILPSEKLRTHIIAPTVFTTSLFCRASDKKADYCKSTSQLCDSRLKKKSKISEVEILKTFLTIQSTMKDCMLASNYCKDSYNRQQAIASSSKSSQGEKVFSNAPQLYEMSATLVKKEIAGASTAENSPLTAENDPASEVNNDPSSKTENPPSLKVENDSGLCEMQLKQKKRKLFQI